MLPLDERSVWSPELRRDHRAILVADVVESVRLLREYEDDVIERWRGFVEATRSQVLPALGGRLVKSLGDGMLLEFSNSLDATRAALDLHRRIAGFNAGRAPLAEMQLRIGIHEADVVVDDLDLYGAGVNLAARLATLAGPGETIVSPEARDALVPGLDVEIEDLGECYLKNVPDPQRAYRVGPVGRHSFVWSGASAGIADRAVVAVIPFAVRGDSGPTLLFGEVIADDLIAQLCRLPQLHVVSRLSTTVFREREPTLEILLTSLGCHFAVHGSCLVAGDQVLLRVQLTDCRDGSVLWADTLPGQVSAVLNGDDSLVDTLTSQVCAAMVQAEVQRAATLPLPSLQSYTILLGAIAMMHRLSLRDFDRSRAMLLYLAERHPRATAPRAWLGKWHVMRVAQGWSPNPVADANEARGVVAKALDLDGQHALALAIDGLICAYINKDLATAAERYAAAVLANPSESLAWLFQSALHSYAEHGELAVDCAMRAQRLSPLDPMKYYYDNFTSTAKLSAGDYAGAIDYGQRSLRSNRTHGATLRILAIAQVLAGQVDDARTTIAGLLRVEPSFTVGRFRERYPGAAAPHFQHYADALRSAGLPA